jgi:general secretion pathway protein E
VAQAPGADGAGGHSTQHPVNASRQAPLPAAPPAPLAKLPPNARLTLNYVVRRLVEKGWLAPTDAQRVFAISDRERNGHPLVLLAEMNFRSPDAAHRLLDLEALTQWLADEAGLAYQHIDPLKVDFTRVVDVMSSAYATSNCILPIAVSPVEVVVATCEPFLDGWIREIEQVTKKTVRRVVASPVDVVRFTTEFYKLAQSVKGATKSGSASLVSNFEQLVELGGKLEANDAHIIHIVD